MTSHPTPKVIAAHLRTVANLLEDHGALAIDLAAALAARGLPSAVGGSGSRSADTTTSVERAAGADLEDRDRSTHWDDVDVRLAKLLRLTWKLGLDVQSTIGDIVAHAQDLDEVPAGTGSCLCCSQIVRPDHKHPGRRLRSGFCPSCYRAWVRWRANRSQHPDRAAFVRERRAELLRRAQERERKRIGA